MEVRSNVPALTVAPRTADKTQSAVAPQPDIRSAARVDSGNAVKQPEPAPSQAQLDDALRSINKSMQLMSQELEFSVDPDTDRTIVKVIDLRTKEVIRQMPSVESLEIAKALDRVQGLLIRQKA